MKNNSIVYALILTGIMAMPVHADDQKQTVSFLAVTVTRSSTAQAGNDASNILQRLVMSITNTDAALHELGMITVTDTSAVASQAAATKAIPPSGGIASVSGSTGR